LLRTSVSWIALVALLAGGCGDGSGDPLSEAEKAWAGSKSSCSTYSYVREAQEPSTIAKQFTSVEVSGDVATRRHFSRPASPQDGYDEVGADIGTHTRGYPALTVEELLDECMTVWRPGTATSPDRACATKESCTFTWRTDERGVPLECVPHPVGVAVDGQLGIIIATFACAPLAADGTVPAN